MAQARVSPSAAHFSYSTPPSPLSLDGKPHSLEGRVSNPPHAQQDAGVAEAAELTADLGAMGRDEELAEEGSCEGGGGLEWRRVVAMLMLGGVALPQVPIEPRLRKRSVLQEQSARHPLLPPPHLRGLIGCTTCTRAKRGFVI
ncbi:unnamed protein product [Closterium sp. Naga37s-1]|nr:unnamed protein product [Closterium sp. Naga37s-1]